MYEEFTITRKKRMLLSLPWMREPGAGCLRVWAGMTHCLYHIAVDGPCLAVTVFSQTVVVPCAADSVLDKCKRGGIICSFLLVLHVGEKKKGHKMIKLSKCKDQILQWEVLTISLSNGCKHYCYSENGCVQLELLFLVRGVPVLQRKCMSLLRCVLRQGLAG